MDRGRIRSFSRRGSAIPPRFATAWARYRDDVVLDLPRGQAETTVAADARIDLVRDWPLQCTGGLVVEIGIGSGDQIAAAAAADPTRRYLGFEVWIPGIAQSVAQIGHQAIRQHGYSPVRIVDRDAQQALPILLEEATADEVWTFFPDPWPKARHHKRRLVDADFANDVARILRPGGIWRLATDSESYAEQMREVLSATSNLLDGAAIERWEGRYSSRFERKGLRAGRTVHDFQAIRTSAPPPSAERSKAAQAHPDQSDGQNAGADPSG